MDAGRWLVYRFFALPHQQRVAVVRALGLVDPLDSTVPEIDHFRQCFHRAREKRLLARLWAEVEGLHADGDTANNPFSGV
jgi:chorismate mutase